MNRLNYTKYKTSQLLIVGVTYAIYVAAFVHYYDRLGMGMAPLSVLPVISASWYFGIGGGLLTAFLSILSNSVTLIVYEGNLPNPVQNPDRLIGAVALLVVAIIIGNLSTIIRDRRNALIRFQQREQDRGSHTTFLETLNKITARALEADTMQATLENLAEQLAGLFHAEDVYFSLWDTTLEVPIPAVAYGSMSDVFPHLYFEPGEVTPTVAVLQAGRPLAIQDIDHSPYISARLANLLPGQSLLGIPLIARHRKLGAIILGYNSKRSFDDMEISQAEIVGELVARVLSKLQLLEDERKQVRQLSALHDVALTTIEADNVDELIERVTVIIGENLFPDNFGIMLLDEREDILRAHPSYRFRSVQNIRMKELHLGEGISGYVARSGQPQRISNVRHVEHYVDVDDRTVSELCVPIKFKEKVLGVINAESTKRDAFTADDERLLVTLAGQLATAIEQLRRAEAEHKWMDQLAHSNGLIYSIAHITTQIERSMSADAIIQTQGKELEKIGLTCIMAAYDDRRESFSVNYTSLEPRLLEIVEAGLGYPLLSYSFPRSKISSLVHTDELLRATVIQHPEQEIKSLLTRINPSRIKAILRMVGLQKEMEPMRLPLVFENNLLGLLWIWGKDLSRSDLPIMSIFAKQLGISLERARLFQEVQSLALTDPLTNLQNRRSVFELGRIEFSRSQRMDRSFSCLMIDIDHFKKINDRYGHQAGDQVLQEFAKRCTFSVREVDLVGRYGGEEFIALMPETDCNTAVRVAERLRAIIMEKPFEIPAETIDITVSIGVATKDENTTHLETLIARADQALYIAKHKGRNRVAISV